MKYEIKLSISAIYMYHLLPVRFCVVMRITREKKFRNGTGSEQLNVLVYAHLSEQNLFSSCSYKEVASSIRNTVHAVALLDRTNVYGQTAIINTGTETARESKKVPVFVPVSYSNGEKR